MIKNLIALAIAISILFTGCDKDSQEADAYDIEKALDEGNYEKVLSSLGDCSQFSGQEQKDCFLNVGAAYFGKAQFDLISMAQEISQIDDTLTSDKKSKEFNKIVFNKLDDENLKKGLDKYKIVVDGNDSVCNNKNYDSLGLKEKSACIAINPLLLSELLGDDKNTNDDNKSENSVSLAQIIEFKDVLKDAVPELKSEDLVTIIDGGENLSTDVDANQNNILDSMEASDYALKVFAFNKSWDGNDTVSSDYNTSVIYTNDELKDKNITLAKITISKNSNSNSFYRLIEYTDDFNTTLTTVPNTVCNAKNTITDGTINKTTILPCVKINTDKNGTKKASSLNDSVVNILNNDNLLSSIALASESEDDAKTDDKKIEEFKADLCGANSSTTLDATNKGNCDFKDGKIVITQEALIDYMNKDK